MVDYGTAISIQHPPFLSMNPHFSTIHHNHNHTHQFQQHRVLPSSQSFQGATSLSPMDPPATAARICAKCGDSHPSGWRRSIDQPGQTVCNKCGLAERARVKKDQMNRAARLSDPNGVGVQAGSGGSDDGHTTKSPRECFVCRVTSSAAWRTSTQHPGQTVCNRCGLRERKGKDKPPKGTPPPQQLPPTSQSSHLGFPGPLVHQHQQLHYSPPPPPPSNYNYSSPTSTSSYVPSSGQASAQSNRICSSCGATASASWRRSVQVPSQMLCNKCGLRERKTVKSPVRTQPSPQMYADPSPSPYSTNTSPYPYSNTSPTNNISSANHSNNTKHIQLPPPPQMFANASTPPLAPHQQHAYQLPPIHQNYEMNPPILPSVTKRCFNCQATVAPGWRSSVMYPGQVVCNRCGLAERRQNSTSTGGGGHHSRTGSPSDSG